MCHRARFFVLVTFLKNPEKIIRVSSNLLSAFIDCLDCFLLLPIRCDKVLEIVTSFLHKTLVTMYLHGT